MKDWRSGYHSVPRHGETVAAGQDLSEKNTESESGRPDMDTLVVEKALQDVRGLQGELAAFGVPVELEDSDADGTVAAVRIPSLYGETEQTIQLDGRVCERGHQAETFEEYRRRVINRLADYCEQEAKDLPSKWDALCGWEAAPLPDNLKTRGKTLEDVALKLRGLLSGDPHAFVEDAPALLGKPAPPNGRASRWAQADYEPLRVEKALQDVHGLQSELAGVGVDDAIELVQPERCSCVAVIRSRMFYDEYDENDDDCTRIMPSGRFYLGYQEPDGVSFEEHRLFIINSLVRYYEHKPRIIEDRWEWLCDGADEPLPVFLQVRMEKLGDVAEKLRGLVREED